MAKKFISVPLFLMLAIILHAQSVTFNYTGAVQTYVVPGCATQLTVTLKGAGGGTGGETSNNTQDIGGTGGCVSGTLNVVGGSTLQIYVGGVGAPGTPAGLGVGGWNGGGNGSMGYTPPAPYPYFGGGGGGASDIRVAPYALANRVVVAGGGGGGAFNYFACCNYDQGGLGGGLTGGTGWSGNVIGGGAPGTGGSQVAGGIGGTWGGYCTAPNGVLGIGSNDCTSYPPIGNAGAGGGGGYYGGGAGCWSGGGGGSSYVAGLSVVATNTQGCNAGNGSIVITPNCALPIKLLSFNAEYIQTSGTVNITWSTATEVNNKFFTVEKSADGINWKTLTIVPATGNSTNVESYSATDETPYAGISYYKLEQTDYDGTNSYSPIASVNIASDYSAHIFPNPAKGNVTLHYITQSPDPINVRIADIDGRVLSNYTIDQVQIGENYFQIASASYARGMYFIEIRNLQKTLYLKFIKE